MGICYIVGAGDFNSPITPRNDDFVIAADGGYDSLMSYGIKADLLIGDLDSVRSVPSGIEVLQHPVEKNETDMYLAYREGVRRGFKDFVILGGSGGRSDHTFANYCLLFNIKNEGNNAILADKNVRTRIIKNEILTLNASKGNTFSMFAFSSDALGVSIRGAKYETNNITLKTDFPLGVSNSFLDTPLTVEVKDGALLLIYEI